MCHNRFLVFFFFFFFFFFSIFTSTYGRNLSFEGFPEQHGVFHSCAGGGAVRGQPEGFPGGPSLVQERCAQLRRRVAVGAIVDVGLARAQVRAEGLHRHGPREGAGRDEGQVQRTHRGEERSQGHFAVGGRSCKEKAPVAQTRHALDETRCDLCCARRCRC